MVKFVARRLLQAIPTLFGIMVLTFLLTRLSPADPISLMAGLNPNVAEADRESAREALGLNDPIPVQFVRWAVDVVQLDFGRSFHYQRPVLDLIGERLVNTLLLSVTGVVLALLVGVPLGIIAALLRGRLADHGIRVVSVILSSTPDFFLGLLFILILGVNFQIFPVGSMNSVGEYCTVCRDRLWHMVGPVLLVASGGLAIYPRFIRTELLEILGQDYVRTARSKGLRERAVVGRHALRNALTPMITLLGGTLPFVIGGSVIVERVFNWPGIGLLIFEAATAKDYPLLQASVLVGSFVLVLSYILRDLLYSWVDPRVKVGA